MGDVWARLEQRERKYAPNTDFAYNSAMIVTFDLEKRFMVTTHLLLKISGNVQHGPNMLKGKYIHVYLGSVKRIFTWSDVTLTLDQYTLPQPLRE